MVQRQIAYLRLKKFGNNLSLTITATAYAEPVVLSSNDADVVTHQRFGPLLFRRIRRLTHSQRFDNKTFPLFHQP